MQFRLETLKMCSQRGKSMEDNVVYRSERFKGFDFGLLEIAWFGVRSVDDINDKVAALINSLPATAVLKLAETARSIMSTETTPSAGYFYNVPEGGKPDDVMIPREFVVLLSKLQIH